MGKNEDIAPTKIWMLYFTRFSQQHMVLSKYMGYLGYQGLNWVSQVMIAQLWKRFGITQTPSLP